MPKTPPPHSGRNPRLENLDPAEERTILPAARTLCGLPKHVTMLYLYCHANRSSRSGHISRGANDARQYSARAVPPLWAACSGHSRRLSQCFLSLLQLLLHFGTPESPVVGPGCAAHTLAQPADHDVALTGRPLPLCNLLRGPRRPDAGLHTLAPRIRSATPGVPQRQRAESAHRPHTPGRFLAVWRCSASTPEASLPDGRAVGLDTELTANRAGRGQTIAEAHPPADRGPVFLGTIWHRNCIISPQLVK